MSYDEMFPTDGAGVLDSLHGEDGEVGCVASFLPGMKLRILTPDMKYERGYAIVRKVNIGSSRIPGNLEFEDKLPKGTRKGDLLLYIAPDPLGLDRAYAPKEPKHA
jgi:hypothetical protein